MINRKQFYGIFSIIILIFIAAVFFSNSGPESVQGDSLQYKNGVLYTKAGEKYTVGMYSFFFWLKKTGFKSQQTFSLDFLTS